MRPVLEDGTTDSNSHRLPLSDDPSEKLHPFSRANNMLNGSLRRYSQCVKGFVSSLSTVFRNVPYLRAIEVSPFVFFLASRISVASAGAEPCEAARPSV